MILIYPINYIKMIGYISVNMILIF